MTCHHDDDRGWLRREWSHVRDHWVSCLAFCLIAHALWEVVVFLVGHP